MIPVSQGKPYAGNPHVRFEERASAQAAPRRSALLHTRNRQSDWKTGGGRGDHRAPRTAPQSETFLWDGLALIQRGDEQFVNEPHIGGGNPVASSKGTSYFNDALGTTVGSKSNGKYSAAALTAFGEDLSTSLADDSSRSPFPIPSSPFFTGKPYVEGLGHAFLMRNYRAGLAKWQTADPMGYPDGWNQLAYCGNGVTGAVDLWGCKEVSTAVEYTKRQSFDPGFPIVWYNSSYDTMAIFKKLTEEAAKIGLTFKDYMSGKFDAWIKGRVKKAANDIAFNAVLNLLIKAYTELYSQYYEDQVPDVEDDIAVFLEEYYKDGWRLEEIFHSGITIDQKQKVACGPLSTYISGVIHHWKIVLKKEVE